jgi:DNA-binding CsgD family transcriptional regulator
MTLAIPSSLSIAAPAAANPSPTPAAAPVAQPVPQNIQVSADTVTLTEAQQVYQLYDHGQTVTQIAISLNLPIESVNSYLGISTSTS